MDLFDFKAQAGKPLYRQITDELRDKILKGKLPSGTRFPPISTLAKKWKTNYFTVHTALLPLAREGLIQSAPRKGTFVHGTKAQLKALCIYFGSTFWSSTGQGFYSALCGILCERCAELEITPRIWIDHRVSRELHTPLPPLLKAVEKGEIQGVIAAMLEERDVKWLKELPVPKAFFWGGNHEAAISSDHGQMLRTSLRRLKKQGCKSVALIANIPELGKSFLREAKRCNLRTAAGWVQLPREPTEADGSASFKKIWSQPARPDGLIVFPDVLARGVLLAMLEARVKIPGQLKAIFHTNAELPFYCPLPVEWIATSVSEIADVLIASIRHQIAGKKPSRLLVPLRLQAAS